MHPISYRFPNWCYTDTNHIYIKPILIPISHLFFILNSYQLLLHINDTDTDTSIGIGRTLVIGATQVSYQQAKRPRVQAKIPFYAIRLPLPVHSSETIFATTRSARQKGCGQHAEIKVEVEEGHLMDQSEQSR